MDWVMTMGVENLNLFQLELNYRVIDPMALSPKNPHTKEE